MAFSVSGFKSNVAKEGFFRPTHYEVMIFAPVSGLDGLRLRTDSISLPGASFLSIDGYRPYNSGVIYNIPYSYNPQSISCSHMLDDDGKILKAFWEWHNLIADLEGEHKHAANYFDEYKGQMDIFIMDNEGKDIQTIMVEDIYPESTDQLQMSWGSSDEIAKLNVSYRFKSYHNV